MPDADRAAAVDALRDLNFEVQAFREAVADHFGLGVRETQAAAHLVTHGQLSAGELSRLLNLTPATVTNLLGRLDRAGLAVATPDPADLRRSVVRPTEHAEALVDQVRHWLGECLDACVGSGLDLAVVVDVITAVRAGLRQARTSLNVPVVPVDHAVPVVPSTPGA